jgi:nitrate reductase delta subunit
MRLRLRAGSRPLADDTTALAWQLGAALIDYPTPGLVEHLDELLAAAQTLPRPLAEPLVRFLAYLEGTDLAAAQEHYVATFDHTRRCCLYLTYFTHGDTRKRGLALVQLKQAYRHAGVALVEDELPDHLSVVLQFGATVDLDTAWELLVTHRASVEMLRLALAQRQSPWHDVAQLICATLPAIGGDDLDAVARLLASGPPVEDVGLAAYAMDPRLNPTPVGVEDLPDPVGARL